MDGSATKVEWRAWGPEAFEEAATSDSPILLSLVVPWSAECREMDEATYAEPAIAANVNDGFVPIRANADRRPRVRERYAMGGFPSTVFLAPDGAILTGATFLGPEGFRGILERVRHTWDERGAAAGSIPRAIRDAEPPGGDLDAEVEAHMVEQLVGAFDDEFGGWGTDVKFPLPGAVEFALVRAREQALRTLEAIRAHLLDTYDGGFYRYARKRNWRGARREKLLDTNAALLRAFAVAYRYTGEEAHREAAERTCSYLTSTLWTGDAFAASQGGDEAHFRLAPTERERTDPPAVDETVYADRNGLAVDALCRLAAYTDDERATRYARRAREHVVAELVDDGVVSHHAGGETGLLADQARVLGGLTTAWSVLGEPDPALSVADRTIERLQADNGAFRDGPADGAGLLDRPLYPLDTNVEVANALLDCALLSGEDRYRRVARETLSAFAGATERMGVELAPYAAAAARIETPVAVRVSAPAGSDLHRAALRIVDHETVVVPDADRLPDGEGSPDGDSTPGANCRPDGEGSPDGDSTPGANCRPDGEARLVVDGEVRGSAAEPAELAALWTNAAGV